VAGPGYTIIAIAGESGEARAVGAFSTLVAAQLRALAMLKRGA
jgi:hypothetical protein